MEFRSRDRTSHNSTIHFDHMRSNLSSILFNQLINYLNENSDMAPRNISVSSIIVKYEKMNFNEVIIEEKETLNIGKIDKYRYNKRKASPKVLKQELENDAKKEKEKLHRNRLLVAEEEMNDRLKWDLDILQDENGVGNNGNECRSNMDDKKCIGKKGYIGIDDKEEKKILKKRNSLNSAKVIVHSLLSNYPLIEYNL